MTFQIHLFGQISMNQTAGNQDKTIQMPSVLTGQARDEYCDGGVGDEMIMIMRTVCVQVQGTKFRKSFLCVMVEAYGLQERVLP